MSEIRSVSVHLDADVASYIAKMRLAGAETDKAFGRSNTGIAQTNSRLQTTESTLTKVDSAARRADTGLRRVESTMSRSGSNSSGFTRATSKLDSFVGKLGLIPSLAIAGGAALVPLAAAAAGVAAAFAAPIAFVGVGGLLFGLLGGQAIKQTQKQYKTIDTLKKSVDSARLSLEQSTRSAGKNAATSATVANAQQRYNKALTAYQQALQGVSPQQRQFHGALEQLDKDFHKFIAGPAGSDLLGPFTQGLKVADDLLPHARPIIHAVSGDLSQLLGELDKYAQTPGFDRFVHQVATQIGPDLLAGGHMIGGFAHGLERLLVLSGKDLSPGLLHGLGDITSNFDHWANSAQGRHDVEDFFRYVHQVGPEVGRDVEAVARAGGHLVHALAPLGPPVLHVIKGIADAISGIPTPVLTALLGGAAVGIAFGKVGGFKAAGALPGALRVGQNIASGLTGGLIPGASTKYGRGVQPVYVTNPGFDSGPGGPGGGGGPKTIVGRAGQFLEKHPVVGAGLAVTGLTLIATGVVYGTIKEFQFGAGTTPDTKHPSGANLTPLQYSQFNQNRLNSNTGGFGSENLSPRIKSTSTAMDSLNNKLAKASQNLELIGHSADRGFGGATTDAAHLAARVDRINGGKASAALDLVGHSAARNFAQASGAADNLQHKVDRPLRVDINTAAANAKIAETDRSMTALSHHRVDPTVNVETAQAEAALRRVYADLAVIRSKTITVTTAHVTGGHSTAGNAAGGYITGPGGPTSDSIPAWLSNGEYVMRAAAVDRYGVHMMHRLNALSFAGGGPVTTTASTSKPDPFTVHLNHDLANLRHTVASLNKELTVEIAQKQRLVAAEHQLASTVTANFRSQLFGVQPTSGIWGASAATDPLSILRGDIRGAREYRRDLRTLRRRGLHGGALAQVTTLADAQQALGLSSHEDREISRLFAVRQRASAAAGARAGDYEFGKRIDGLRHEIRGTNRRLDQLRQEVHHQTQEQAKHPAATGKAVGAAVNNGVRNGVRRGSKP